MHNEMRQCLTKLEVENHLNTHSSAAFRWILGRSVVSTTSFFLLEGTDGMVAGSLLLLGLAFWKRLTFICESTHQLLLN